MPLNPPASAVIAPAADTGKSLNECCQGETVTVLSISRSLSCGQRLRELGLVEGTPVLMLKRSDPLLVLVRDSRIALDPRTARAIKVVCNCVVQPVPATAG